MICCTAKQPQSRSELWNVHLIPARGATMFALKSIGRKRYARTSPIIGGQNGDANGKDFLEQVQIDATNPWDSETLFQFKYCEGGRYALLTSTCKYVTNEGVCIDANKQTNGTVIATVKQNGIPVKNGSTAIINGMASLKLQTTLLPPVECLFTIEYHGGSIAFRDQNGRYLAGTGRASVLKTRSTSVSRDELFVFEEAPIQVAFRATFNNKWVSVKQGRCESRLFKSNLICLIFLIYLLRGKRID